MQPSYGEAGILDGQDQFAAAEKAAAPEHLSLYAADSHRVLPKHGDTKKGKGPT